MMYLDLTQITPTESSKGYIGSMYKKYIQPWMQSSNKVVQSKSVLFYSKWLPIHFGSASVSAIEQLMMGLKQSRKIRTENWDERVYEQNFNSLSEVTTANTSGSTTNSAPLP
jgi:hypothetical protein